MLGARDLLKTSVLLAAVLLSAPAAGAAPLDFSPCYLPGLAERARCARLAVPEDRSDPGSRALELALAVVPASSARPLDDPLVLFAGGPGQAARDLARLADLAFGQTRRRRDLVLVDLRGTGGSAPLACPSIGDALTVEPAQLRELAARCLAELGGVDVRRYTSDAAIDDVAAALDALGYRRVNLWGGSFGTRAALIFALRYPERVRAAVLDASAPFELRYPLHVAADTERVLDAYLERCAADAACNAAYPRLEATLDTLLASLAEPREVVLDDPLTGRPARRAVSRDGVLGIVRGMLYVPEHAALLPHALSRAAAGDFGPLFALADSTAAWSTRTMSLGSTLAIICSEELPRIDASEVEAAAAGTRLGRSFFDGWAAMCADWPRGALAPEYEVDVVLPIPALILTGTLDPVTPERLGLVMAERFARSRVVVVPGGGHTVSAAECVPRLIAEFLDHADPAALDLSCLERATPPAFLIDPTLEGEPR